MLAHIVEVPGQDAQPGWLAFADGWLWAGSNSIVRKIDPVSNRIVAKTKVPGRISDLAVDNGVWVAVTPDDLLFKLNEDDLTLEASLAAGRDPERLSTGGGRVWLANAAGRAVSSVSEATLARSEHRLTARPRDHGRRWWWPPPRRSDVASGAAAANRRRGDQDLDARAGSVSRAGDAAHSDDRAVEFATCANLLGFSDSAGIDGGTLHPEVAAAMPTVSADGRTYTFRVRPGFRFSPPSNQAVTAGTFRYTFERRSAFPTGPAVTLETSSACRRSRQGTPGTSPASSHAATSCESP